MVPGSKVPEAPSFARRSISPPRSPSSVAICASHATCFGDRLPHATNCSKRTGNAFDCVLPYGVCPCNKGFRLLLATLSMWPRAHAEITALAACFLPLLVKQPRRAHANTGRPQLCRAVEHPPNVSLQWLSAASPAQGSLQLLPAVMADGGLHARALGPCTSRLQGY